MKNLFTFIVALFMATSMYAQKTVTYSFTDGTVGTSSDGLPSLTFSDGAVLKLSAAKVGTSEKKFDKSENITVDGVEKQTIKLSKGLQTILELPAPATKITLYSFYNDNAVATKALYWKEFVLYVKKLSPLGWLNKICYYLFFLSLNELRIFIFITIWVVSGYPLYLTRLLFLRSYP